MPSNLETYRTKRNFHRTTEPTGAKPVNAPLASAPSFTVQRHHARRLHYDFRLEMDGVLKSWAVPKGPCLDPHEKRLAVQVEDHPVAYGTFEGTIPKGEYGGGTVVLWDHGTWEPLGDPDADYRSGKLKFKLHGTKLQGGWTLVQIQGQRSEDGTNWLLIKENDEAAVPLSKSDVLVAEPGSVKARKAQRKGHAARSLPALRPKVVRQAAVPPTWIPPQLATLASAPPDGDRWIHEVKYDGYRLLAVKNGDDVALFTRSGQDWTAKLRSLANEVREINSPSLAIDGELVALDADGVSHFQLLQQSFKAKRSDHLRFYAFDLLHHDGTDLTKRALHVRKRLLAKIVATSTGPILCYSDHVKGRGAEFFRVCMEKGLEGIVSKNCDAPYTSGRSRSWVKVKGSLRQEFVIGGFTKPNGTRVGLGALVLGYYQGGDLIYCGRVGTGFDGKVLKDLTKRFAAKLRDKTPFAVPPVGRERRGVSWVEPSLVCEVAFAAWTGDMRVRQASFLGLRLDKPAREVGLEQPKTEVPAARRRRSAKAPVSDFAISHPDRILYPDAGITKQQLDDYFQSVARWILPHIVNRPLSLLRCPRGIGATCFFQKHFHETLPAGLRSVAITETNTKGNYVVLDDERGLERLVQLGVLELHPWGSQVGAIETPDRLTFDLDPGPGVTMPALAEAARTVHAYLADLGLRSFLKTSGGKGLHVVVPIVPTLTWPAAKEFAKAISERIARDAPNLYVAKMTKSLRPGKIFVDYLRNGRGATSVAAYSSRARAGAPVSMPLAWEDLAPWLDPLAFTVTTVPGILASRAVDPWSELGDLKQEINPKIKALLPRG